MSTSFSGFTPDSTERQVFTANQNTGSTAATSTAQIWRKPKGLRFSSWFLIGAGAGGGAGASGAAATNRGGGGGGGSGAIVRAIFLNDMLPDNLYVFVPGNAATASPGGLTCVSLFPNSITANNLLLISGALEPTAGGTGTASAGTAGAAGQIATRSNHAAMAIAWVASAGQAGALGGASGSVGVNRTVADIVTGGAGGGGAFGVGAAGGAITDTNGLYPSQATDTNGSTYYRPYFFSYGGSGGTSFSATAGNPGANGGVGSGGGGGGAGNGGGAGGRGGPGICFVNCW